MIRALLNQYNYRVSLISGLALVLLILSAGYSVYSLMQPQIKEMTVSSLQSGLQNKITLIETYIANSVANTQALTTRTFLLQSLEQYIMGQSREQGMAGIIKSADRILETHFSSIAFHNP